MQDTCSKSEVKIRSINKRGDFFKIYIRNNKETSTKESSI